MKNHAKNLYGKMIDFKRFAVALLAAGVFFYLGVIIPSGTKTVMSLNILILSSMSFLAASVFFFILSKKCRMKLEEMEEGQEYLMKK